MKLLKYVSTFVLLLTIVIFTSETHTDAKQTFKDVSTTNSFYQDIEWAVSKGLLKGYSDGTFKPANYLTEAQFAKIFTRYSDPSILEDIDAAEETTTVYDYLSKNDIILGGHSNKNAMNQNFTRIQVAKVFYQYVEGKTATSNTAAIDWMYEKGLTTGKGVSSDKYTDFGSNDALKRSQISAFFSRLDKLLNKEPLSEDAIVNTIAKNYIDNTFELMQYDRINLTANANDEYFFYFRDKQASLVDEAKNIYVIASFNANTETHTVLKTFEVTSTYSFIERATLNSYEQMVIHNAGLQNQLQLSFVAATTGGSIEVTTLTKNYPNGSFEVIGNTLKVYGEPNIVDSYTISNGKLVR